MRPEIPAVEEAVPAVRALLRAAALPFKFAGGVAVAHHGYVRTTVDVDVLVDAVGLPRLDAELSSHDFVREGPTRLRHLPTDTPVDLLPGGHPMPRPGSPHYPRPQEVEGSPEDPEVLALPALVMMKLYAHRHQDLADVVALLKGLDDGSYLALEASLPAPLRAELSRLREDALDELRYSDNS